MPRRRSSRPELPSLTRAVAEAVAPRPPDPVGDECRRLLALLRKQCPGLIPAAPLPAGQPGPEIPLSQEPGKTLYRLVARQISGLPTQAAAGEAGVVVWTQGDDELAVLVNEVVVTTAQGAIAIDIPVRCDQVGTATVRVRFATGSDARPAGFVAATDERPLGPAAVVDVWGEALTAFAWHIMLTTTAKLADASGRDADGAGLIPVGVRAAEAGVVVVAMARHTFDRKVIG
jgi:hypothetical protein